MRRARATCRGCRGASGSSRARAAAGQSASPGTSDHHRGATDRRRDVDLRVFRRGEVERGTAGDQREADTAGDVRDERARVRRIDAVLTDRVALIRVLVTEPVVERAVVAGARSEPEADAGDERGDAGAAEREAEDPLARSRIAFLDDRRDAAGGRLRVRRGLQLRQRQLLDLGLVDRDERRPRLEIDRRRRDHVVARIAVERDAERRRLDRLNNARDDEPGDVGLRRVDRQLRQPRLEILRALLGDVDARGVAGLRGERDDLSIVAPRARELALLLVAGGEVEQRTERRIELEARLEARTCADEVSRIHHRLRLLEQLFGGGNRVARLRMRGHGGAHHRDRGDPFPHDPRVSTRAARVEATHQELAHSRENGSYAGFAGFGSMVGAGAGAAGFFFTLSGFAAGLVCTTGAGAGAGGGAASGCTTGAGCAAGAGSGVGAGAAAGCVARGAACSRVITDAAVAAPPAMTIAATASGQRRRFGGAGVADTVFASAWTPCGGVARIVGTPLAGVRRAAAVSVRPAACSSACTAAVHVGGRSAGSFFVIPAIVWSP